MEMVSKSPAVQMIEQFRAWLDRSGVELGTQAEVDAAIDADHAEALREDVNGSDMRRCTWCGKRGGTLMPDPYELEIHGVNRTTRLHEACAAEMALEI